MGDLSADDGDFQGMHSMLKAVNIGSVLSCTTALLLFEVTLFCTCV